MCRQQGCRRVFRVEVASRVVEHIARFAVFSVDVALEETASEGRRAKMANVNTCFFIVLCVFIVVI